MRLFNISLKGYSVSQAIDLLKSLKKNLTDNPTVFINATTILAQIEAVLTALSDAHDAVVENDSVAKSLTATQQAAFADCAPVVKAVGAITAKPSVTVTARKPPCSACRWSARTPATPRLRSSSRPGFPSLRPKHPANSMCNGIRWPARTAGKPKPARTR